MFRKIVWATDGSESADRALAVVKSLASGDGVEVIAVHSIEYVAGKGAAFPEADESGTEAKLKGQVAELGDSASLQVVEGGFASAAHAIARAATDNGADLIVVGTRGQTPLAGLLLGSVTQRLLHIAPCPVLVVPES